MHVFVFAYICFHTLIKTQALYAWMSAFVAVFLEKLAAIIVMDECVHLAEKEWLKRMLFIVSVYLKTLHMRSKGHRKIPCVPEMGQEPLTFSSPWFIGRSVHWF